VTALPREGDREARGGDSEEEIQKKLKGLGLHLLSGPARRAGQARGGIQHDRVFNSAFGGIFTAMFYPLRA